MSDAETRQEAFIKALSNAGVSPSYQGDGVFTGESRLYEQVFDAACEWQASHQAIEGERDPVMEVGCDCGDFYRANSFGAGFIAGTGVCENCAAINGIRPAKEAKGRIEGDKYGYGRIADPALEGEPVAYQYWWKESPRQVTVCKGKDLPDRYIGLIIVPLYTHPASADVSDWEIEAKRAFWSGLEIGASMGAVSIAPRWDEYVAKRKEEMGQGVTGGGV